MQRMARAILALLLAACASRAKPAARPLENHPSRSMTVGPTDRDGDGVPDDTDQCPDTAEDKDGVADGDGCPETDADKDGIPDDKDKCPEAAEDGSTPPDDGCPAPREFDED
jgi:hypothetical protein